MYYLLICLNAQAFGRSSAALGAPRSTPFAPSCTAARASAAWAASTLAPSQAFSASSTRASSSLVRPLASARAARASPAIH